MWHGAFLCRQINIYLFRHIGTLGYFLYPFYLFLLKYWFAHFTHNCFIKISHLQKIRDKNMTVIDKCWSENVCIINYFMALKLCAFSTMYFVPRGLITPMQGSNEEGAGACSRHQSDPQSQLQIATKLIKIIADSFCAATRSWK